MLIGALEAGGATMNASIGNAQRGVMQRASFPTGAPDETIAQVAAFFKMFDIRALGVGSFGPLDLNPQSPTYGHILGTPKEEWRNYPLLSALTGLLGVPALIDTAVNVSALAENRMGAGVGTKNMLYVTVGAGVGGGILIGGEVVHGLTHPELGHMIVSPLLQDPMQQGVCPFHRQCLEGLASEPAMEKRWGLSPRLMTPDHPAWDMEAAYLAQLCANAIVMLSPEKIVLGGPVMQMNPALYPMIRAKTLELLGGYVASPCMTEEGMEKYIVPSKLGVNAGVTGALLLGARALEDH